MNLKALTPGTVLLVGALSLSAGWMAGRSSTPNLGTQNAPTARQRAGARPAGQADDVAPFTGQLRKRLESQPVNPPATGRNPFTFGTRRAPSVARNREEPEVAPAPPPEPVVFTPPAPQIKLSGIASNQEAGAAVLTAIINDNGALVFAKMGDKLSNGATVVSISESAVVLMDAAGLSQTFRLQ
jgi:hypothetical protein